MTEKLKVDADVAGFVKAKETVKHGLDEIEKKAQKTSATAAAAMDKVTASMARAGKAGAGGAAASSARGAVGSGIGSLAGSAVAGRVGGAAVGRGLGAAAGAVGGPLGMIAGSLIGGGIASMLGGGRDSGPSREEEKADLVGQLIARGFSKQQSTAFASLGQDMEAKFKISAERISSAVTDANSGDMGALAGILKDAGIDPETVGTVNEALERLAAASNGAAEKAEEAAKGPIGKAMDRLSKTEVGGAGLGDFFSGIAKAPGEIFSNALAGGINTVSNVLGGPTDYGKEPSGKPAMSNDAALNKDPAAKKRGGGDMRIVVSAPKSVPTVTKNMGGR